MLVGRFLPMLFVLGLAGSLAAQKPVPATEGTLPTHRPLFVAMLVGVVVVVVALTYFPALALGPLAEGMHPMTDPRPPRLAPDARRRRAARPRACWSPSCRRPAPSSTRAP